MHAGALGQTTTNRATAELDNLAGKAPAGLPSLLGATREDLERLAETVGASAYRGRQIFAGLYRKGHRSFAEMTDLPRRLRQSLEERFDLSHPRIADQQRSNDGTRKYRFLGADGAAFEAVYLPEVAHGRKTNTLCVSCQSGCSLGCRFCFTATLRRHRNLTTAEIVGQVLAAQTDVKPLGIAGRLTNVVFMGMGEPLLNYDSVVRAARILIDSDGLSFSTRRVTVSTAGIVPRLQDLGRDLGTQLAVSLNATTDEVRTHLMPINRTWPLAALLAALRAFPLPKRRRITIEYVLLKGVNDTPDDARRLPRLLARIPVKVNLLPLNPHVHTELEPSPPETVLCFQEILQSAGINTLVRTPRGQDIAAACGQLGEHAPATAAPSEP